MQVVDPWRLRLERVRDNAGFDGLVRISTQAVMDILVEAAAGTRKTSLMAGRVAMMLAAEG
jgi:hypothetical protein